MGGMRKGFIIVYTTVGKRKDAEMVAQKLLEKRYIACANIFPMEANYWWQGKIEKAKEFGLFLKTKKENYKIIERELKRIHPYELPCILSWRIERGEKNYLKWLKESIEFKEGI